MYIHMTYLQGWCSTGSTGSTCSTGRTGSTCITKEWPTCVGVVCTILAGGHGSRSPSVSLCDSAEFQPVPGNHLWSTN